MKFVLGADAIQPTLTGIGRYAFELAHGLMGSADAEMVYADFEAAQKEKFIKHSGYKVLDCVE
jgi:hypothetical protein